MKLLLLVVAASFLTAQAWAATTAQDLDPIRYLITRERFQDALPLAERAARQSPDNVEAQDLYSQVLVRLNRHDEAIAVLAPAVRAHPDNAAAQIHLGDAYLAQYLAGIEAWRKVHGDNMMLGTITSSIPGGTAGGSPRYFPSGGPTLGVTDKASILMRHENDWIPPRWNPGRSGMGDLRRPVALMNARERELHEIPIHAAMQAFSKALSLAPDSMDALRGRSFAQYALMEYGPAADGLFKVAGSSRDPGLYAAAAEAYTHAENPNGAINAWETLIEREPTHREAYGKLRALYEKFRSHRWETRYYEGMEHLLNNDPEGALDRLDWVTSRHPEYGPGWRATGSAWLALKKPAKARESLQKAVEAAPEDGLSYYELAVAQLMSGDKESAREALKTAVRLRPDHAPIWYTLGMVAESDNDLHTASSHYEKAVSLNPQWPEAHYSLGAVLLDLRDGGAAVTHLERYLELKPRATDAADVRKTIDQVRTLLANNSQP